VEPEDVDLGSAELDDLAFDVDTELHDRDPEALDSDNERGVDEELGIDAEETDCTLCTKLQVIDLSVNKSCSTNAHCSIIFSITK
jgi:hypothetical protein